MNGTTAKRSPQLQPLSFEHEDGLLFVSRLREGLSNQTDIHRLNKYVKWYWKYHVIPHFFQEEKILLPYIPVNNKIRHILEDDHSEIIQLMRAINEDSDRNDIKVLANLIERHIGWEEREFFHYLELNLSPKELEDILGKLRDHPVSCKYIWNDEFWLKKSF